LTLVVEPILEADFLTSLPLMRVAPARTSGTRWGALTPRHPQLWEPRLLEVSQLPRHESLDTTRLYFEATGDELRDSVRAIPHELLCKDLRRVRIASYLCLT
jgi:hypothetical protein